jgi:hypothetical protein
MMPLHPQLVSFPLVRYTLGRWVPVRLYLPVLLWLLVWFLSIFVSDRWGLEVSARATTGAAIAWNTVFFALLFLAFLRVRRWRAEGRIELRLEGETLRLVDPVSQAVLGKCPARAERVLPAEFDYSNFWSTESEPIRGIPAFILDLEGGTRVAVSVWHGRFVWREGATRLKRPEYSMGMREWEKFIEVMNLSKCLVRRPDPTGLEEWSRSRAERK